MLGSCNLQGASFGAGEGSLARDPGRSELIARADKLEQAGPNKMIIEIKGTIKVIAIIVIIVVVI